MVVKYGFFINKQPILIDVLDIYTGRERLTQHFFLQILLGCDARVGGTFLISAVLRSAFSETSPLGGQFRATAFLYIFYYQFGGQFESSGSLHSSHCTAKLLKS